MRNGWLRRSRVGLVAITLAFAVLGVTGAPPASALPAAGYRLLGGDGGVFTFGASKFFGSGASIPSRCAPNTVDRTMPNGTCVAIAPTSDNGGYWILNASTGAIFRFGNAGSFGQPATQFAGVAREFVPTFASIVSTSDSLGYWVLGVGLSGTGTVFHFGDAGFFGDTTTIARTTHAGFNGEPVGMAATPSGNGYWEVHSDGGVFSFGGAKFYGSMGGHKLNRPVVGMAVAADGKGYWLVASDGGVFAFGSAKFAGSLGGRHLSAPIVGMTRAPSGYWLTGSDGAVYPFGGAPSLGSLQGTRLARPIFAISG